jgi:lysozyme family protein
MKFDTAVEYILDLEGGYVFDSNDPGGETKYGISKRSFPHLHIKNLSRDQAKDIYREYYWQKMQCEVLPGYLRLMVFDCAVNQGVARSARLLQASVGAEVDGQIGTKTLKKAQDGEPIDVLTSFSAKRHQSYAKNPRWKFYGAGWSKRLLEISLLCAFLVAKEKAK